MGHQTSYKICKKCKGITITTQINYLMISDKRIMSSNCKCKKNESNNR
jgi:hypothetical protein